MNSFKSFVKNIADKAPGKISLPAQFLRLQFAVFDLSKLRHYPSNHDETFKQDRVEWIISEFPSPVRQQNSHHEGAALVDEENLEQGQGRTAKGGGDSVVTQEGI